MTATVTPLMATWAQAFVDSIREVAELRGEPFNEEQVTHAIRSALTEPLNLGPADDCDGIDPEDMPNVPGYLQGRDL